jgi:hypothetical protein
MRNKKTCTECTKFIVKDQVALSLKMLGRNISGFYCIDCLAEYLECERDDLEVKILEFKEQGCTLFL